MKIILTESQLSLLLEQSNVYTDKESYNNALKIYNEVWDVYKDSIEYFNFLKSKKVNCCSHLKAEKPLNVSMIKLLSDKMNKCKEDVYNIGSVGAENTSNLSSLKRMILDAVEQTEKQKTFLDTYLSKNLVGRKLMMGKFR